MKYAEMIQTVSPVKATFLVEVLNAVVTEARDYPQPNNMVNSIASNWRMTGEEHTAIVEEAKRILNA